MQALGKSIAKFVLVGVEFTNRKAVLQFLFNMKPQLFNEDLINSLQGELPVEMLFCD